MVEKIVADNKEYAMIIRGSFSEPGVTFFTPNEYSQQLAYMKHPTGKIIIPHVHNPVPREVTFTSEVLIIRKGKLRVDFYHENKEYFGSKILGPNDIILLVSGGHGFEVLEELEMVEIKQGPYAGESDKTRFQCNSEQIIKMI